MWTRIFLEICDCLQNEVEPDLFPPRDTEYFFNDHQKSDVSLVY